MKPNKQKLDYLNELEKWAKRIKKEKDAMEKKFDAVFKKPLDYCSQTYSIKENFEDFDIFFSNNFLFHIRWAKYECD